MKPLNILLASDGRAGEIYADALQQAFTQLGHQATAFHWRGFFYNQPYEALPQGWLKRLRWAYYRAQNKFTCGPRVWALNHALLKQCREELPDLLFVYRGTHVWPSTLRAIRQLGITIFGYTNDDPFSKQYPAYFWRHFRGGLPFYHHLFAYRAKNLADYAAVGIHATSLLRSYYLAASNRPVAANPAWQTDVIFIGHYEADGRDAALLLLLENGVKVGLYGHGWEASPRYGALLAALGVATIRPLYGTDYNQGLCSAKLALVFLSKLNHDSYTRRNFEIPATGTCMVAEYTDDLAHNLFTPDTEAVYFRSHAELLMQVQRLLANPALAAEIGAAGRARLLRDGHEVTDRAQQVLAQYAKLMQSPDLPPAD